MVHNRTFPGNDRTVSSLKKKFRDLCRTTSKPVSGFREVEKAREVQFLIVQKPPGFQLVLPTSSSDELIQQNNLPSSIPNFHVRVPDPLQPKTTEHVPEFIQIPESPTTHLDNQIDEDEMSELDLDEYEADVGGVDSVIINELSQVVSHNGPVVTPTPCVGEMNDNKLPVIIFDHK